MTSKGNGKSVVAGLALSAPLVMRRTANRYDKQSGNRSTTKVVIRITLLDCSLHGGKILFSTVTYGIAAPELETTIMYSEL